MSIHKILASSDPESFDDLEHDFDNPLADMAEDHVGTASSGPVDMAVAAAQQFEKIKHADPELFRETCPRCNGTGRYRAPSSLGTQCFKCGGAGYKMYKKSAVDRAAARTKSADLKIKKAQAAVDAFEAQYPQVAAWYKSDFPFAVSMREAVRKFGSLTPGQLSASLNCITKFEAAKAAKAVVAAVEAKRVDALPTLNVAHIADAFARAKDKGIKRPKLRLFSGTTPFQFSRAPDTGKNPGAIYVNDQDGEYIGKVMAGKFMKAFNCGPETEAEVLKVCSDPEQAAIAYGKQFGSCSACGRELTDPISIANGIGPICAINFF